MCTLKSRRHVWQFQHFERKDNERLDKSWRPTCRPTCIRLQHIPTIIEHAHILQSSSIFIIPILNHQHLFRAGPSGVEKKPASWCFQILCSSPTQVQAGLTTLQAGAAWQAVSDVSTKIGGRNRPKHMVLDGSWIYIPSGNSTLLKNPFKMVIFHSYFSLPAGTSLKDRWGKSLGMKLHSQLFLEKKKSCSKPPTMFYHVLESQMF